MHRVNQDLPASIEAITVVGNERTKYQYFDDEFQNCKGLSHSLDELLSKVQSVTERMNGSGIFEAVHNKVVLKTAEDGRFQTDIQVTVKEVGIPLLKMESYVRTGKSSSDVGCEIQGALRNPTGRGEILKMSASTNSAAAKEFSVSLGVPNVSPDKGKLTFSLKNAEEDNSHFLSYKQHVQTFGLEYIFRDGRHKISSEATVRDEIPSRDPSHSFARKASSATMALAGPSSKFATKYTWIAVDTRDRKNDPSRGSYLESEIEVSSRPGSSEFVKADIQTQIHGTVGSDIWGQRGLTLSLCGSLGVLYPYRLLLESPTSYGRVKSESQETARPLSPMSPGFICLSDRYHAGGPLSLRGFDLYGIGERAERRKVLVPSPSSGDATSRSDLGIPDALGGGARCSLLALLSVPVPIHALATNGLRAFAFLNFGSLGSADYWGKNHQRSTVASRAGPLFGYMRASVGGGVVMPIASAARVEFTYSLPLLKAPGDVTKQFQIGVGLSIS